MSRGGRPVFRKLLVANRGEIALRVQRAARELGIPTVAIYSEADRNALHVRFADEAVCVGPAPARQSYLHVPNVLGAAEITGADAVHPGYGFLAESASFAAAVRDHGLRFVGPDPGCLATFGDKLASRALARAAGVPLLPGSDGPVATEAEAVAVARRVGFPVLLKAARGGGGKGMRVAADEASLRRGFRLAAAEAEAAFGDGTVYLERYLPAPRHVEVQVAGDREGRLLHLGERDCSLQRRHQKLVEEAPAPGLPGDLRRRLREAAVRVARRAGLTTLGTVEFLVDGDEFFFLEVNPRIQVEHPVTEEVTGVDLVALQIRLAAGEAMPLDQAGVALRGHAIEVRINAEHPETFRPSPGRVTGYHAPGGFGVRVDSAAHEHFVVQPWYDSLVAKLVAWAPDRRGAIRRCLGALDELVVEGVHTTAPLVRGLVGSEAFARGEVDTRLVERWLAERAGGEAPGLV